MVTSIEDSPSDYVKWKVGKKKKKSVHSVWVHSFVAPGEAKLICG